MSTGAPHVYFDAVLHPHRSLPPNGFLILMIGVGVVSFVTGIAFLLMGAWPVFGFFGLDVALIYFAFRMNYRAARMVEHVRLTDTALEVERVHPSGKVERWTTEPAWVRADVAASPRGQAIRFKSRNERMDVGRFLSPEEQDSFTDAFRAALRRRIEGLATGA